jgi:hypothetical protein
VSSIIGGLKTKSGASSVSGGNTLEETLCLKITRLKIRATNEILWSMFFSYSKVKIKINRLTAIRFWWEQKTPTL